MAAYQLCNWEDYIPGTYYIYSISVQCNSRAVNICHAVDTSQPAHVVKFSHAVTLYYSCSKPVLVLLQSFGDGSVAQFVLGREQYGTFLTVNWAWGLAVAMGVWASGGVSGKTIKFTRIVLCPQPRQ